MAIDNVSRLVRLERRHRQLDVRVGELSRQRFLSPAEQTLVRSLKKERLRAKDRIASLRVAASGA